MPTLLEPSAGETARCVAALALRAYVVADSPEPILGRGLFQRSDGAGPAAQVLPRTEPEPWNAASGPSSFLSLRPPF